MKKLITLAVLIICSSIIAQKKSNVIVFSKTAGYRHQSIEVGVEALKKLGDYNDFLVYATEDSEELVSNLKNCEVIIFLNTTGNIFNENQKKLL